MKSFGVCISIQLYSPLALPQSLDIKTKPTHKNERTEKKKKTYCGNAFVLHLHAHKIQA